MQEIIMWLLVLIQYQSQVITALCFLCFGKSYKPPKAEKCVDKKYTHLNVDPLPIFGEPPIQQIYQYTVLLENYRQEHGKDMKPINRKGKTPPKEAVCPYCGAPHEYIYDNDGRRGQLLCKVCKSTFHLKKHTRDDEPYCPFCHSKLVLIKKRETFDIYRCNHKDCPFRRKNLSAMSPEQKALFKKSPHSFKLRLGD